MGSDGLGMVAGFDEVGFIGGIEGCGILVVWKLLP